MISKMPAAFSTVLCCLFAACTRDHSAPQKKYASYSCLKTGNYWIYQIFEVDSAGNGLPTSEYDSCYIARDTVIRGNAYYYLSSQYGVMGGFTCEQWLRDSLSYIVNDAGVAWFCSEAGQPPFASYLITHPGTADTLAWVTDKMESDYATTAVPAGLFVTLNCKRKMEIWPRVNGTEKVRYAHRRYALHLGIVSETMPFYPATTVFREKRLVRYSIN